MRPVLFISHYSGRTGAPLVLLRLLQWLKANTSLQLHVLLRSSGELRRDFESVASVFVVPRVPRIPSAILRRLFGQAAIDKIEDLLLRRRVRRLRPVLIYSNTITNTREINALAALDIPALCHVHEMEYWIRYELGLDRAISTIPFFRRFIAVSSAVSDFLVAGVGVRPELIEVIHGFPFSVSHIPTNMNELRSAARRELSIDESTFLVGACGTVDWRKGADLFLAVARAVSQTPGNHRFRFVWVGGPVSGTFFNQLQHDLARSQLSDLVSFVGPCSSPDKYYAAMDVFLLSSREDPFPLVMLEAAAFGRPILCFAKSGGASEFVASDAGIAVPYLDIRSMTDALFALERSPALQARFGGAVRQRVQLRHNPDTQCAAIFAAMTRTQPLLAGASQ